MNSTFTISLFLLAAIACLSKGCLSIKGCCPERFIQVGDRCYHYNSDKVDWHDARHACENLGADLVSIHNYEDSREVFELWKSFVDSSYADGRDWAYWIGLHDLRNENNFQWSDGTPMDYSLWRSGEPNNQRGEDCVNVRNLGSNDYLRQQWNDRGCEYKSPYFCRRSVFF